MTQMRQTLSAVAMMIVATAVAAGQQLHGQGASGAAEQELLELSRQTVSDALKTRIEIVETAGVYRTPGVPVPAVVTGEWAEVNLNDVKVRVVDGEAVVSGIVVFKGEGRGRRAEEGSTPAVLRFVQREGRWQLTGLCIGKCPAE